MLYHHTAHMYIRIYACMYVEYVHTCNLQWIGIQYYSQSENSIISNLRYNSTKNKYTITLTCPTFSNNFAQWLSNSGLLLEGFLTIWRSLHTKRKKPEVIELDTVTSTVILIINDYQTTITKGLNWYEKKAILIIEHSMGTIHEWTWHDETFYMYLCLLVAITIHLNSLVTNVLHVLLYTSHVHTVIPTYTVGILSGGNI